MIKVFAIVNHKGGVAKTTSAVNLSYETARLGFKTLLIDTDPQANATKCFGIFPNSLKTYIGDIFELKHPISEVIIKANFKNLSIIPSSITLSTIQAHPPMGADYIIKKSLIKIWNDYDYVFIDTPPNLGIMTTSALAAATHVLIPIQCEYLPLHGVTDIITIIQKAQGALNENLELAGAFLTMVDERSNYTKQTIGEIKDFFKDKLFKTTIRRTIRIPESQSNHVPVVEYVPNHPVSEDYTELVKEIL